VADPAKSTATMGSCLPRVQRDFKLWKIDDYSFANFILPVIPEFPLHGIAGGPFDRDYGQIRTNWRCCGRMSPEAEDIARRPELEDAQSMLLAISMFSGYLHPRGRQTWSPSDVRQPGGSRPEKIS
jgi:hypothetical protein